MAGAKVTDLESVVEGFKRNAKPLDRYTSFDYCYNYFLSTQDLKADIEKSCLVLGFYLASWGMLRGSSFLLQKSVKFYEPVIHYTSTLDKSIWKIDVQVYNDENIRTIIGIYNDIKDLLIRNGNSDLTLVTKVLLGVFGFVPAYDTYFCKTFRELYRSRNCGFRRMNIDSLKCIHDFYENNKLTIDKISNATCTLDFTTGNYTDIKYPRAKIIDMYGFSKGLR